METECVHGLKRWETEHVNAQKRWEAEKVNAPKRWETEHVNAQKVAKAAKDAMALQKLEDSMTQIIMQGNKQPINMCQKRLI